MKKSVLLLVCLTFVLAFSLIQVRQVAATDYSSYHHYNIAAGSYEAVSWALSSGDGIYGNLTVTSGAGINFFICDSANFNNFTSGKPFLCYLYQSNIASYKWKFSVPYSDTWYIVYDNTYSLLTSKTVDTWLCRDDTPPVISILSTSINGATYYNGASNQITITASASDNIQISSFVPFGLYIDGSLVSSTSSITYNFNTNTMSTGSHTVEFVAWDWANHETTVTWTFQIVTLPTIDQPSAITYVVGATGNAITWHPSSQIPYRYTISVNGAVVNSYSWTGGSVTYSVDGLSAGTYSVTCTVYDTQGKSASSTVTVTAQPSPIVTLGLPIALIGGVVVVVAVVALVWSRSKKK